MISALVFIVLLALLIFVHELGHFLLAKACGIGVLEFAIGFGKVIWSFQRGETRYSLRAIPLGGFVRMVGDDPSMRGQDMNSILEGKSAEEAITATYSKLNPEQIKLLKDRSSWFIEKGYFKKLAVVLAGPGFNFLFALLLAIGYFQYFGKPDLSDIESARVGETFPGHPADEAGIKALDLVKSIDGEPINSWKDLAEKIAGSNGKELEIVVARPKSSENLDQSDDLAVKVTPTFDLSNELAALEGEEPVKVYKIGISPYIPRVPTSGIGESMALGANHVVSLSSMLTHALWGMVRGLVSTDNLGGPISIFKATSASAERGSESIISLLIFLNISLAIFNLLPIPILDGGHVVLFTIESLKGSPISLKVLERVNQVGIFLILLLMVYAIGNDIRRLF